MEAIDYSTLAEASKRKMILIKIRFSFLYQPYSIR